MPSLRLLQIADSAFPTGGFAHSFGLEAAVQLGAVHDRRALGAFLEAAIWQAGLVAMPLARAAHADPGAHARIDAVCDAFLANGVANRASRTQGRALLATCARVFESPAIGAMNEAARADGIAAHHAPAWGAALRSLEVPEHEMHRLLVFSTVRGVTSAAVRLGLVGPLDAQRMQSEAFPAAERVLVECAALGLDDLAQPAPALDVLAGAHDRLYTRLFQS
jgi:urease accessory protein